MTLQRCFFLLAFASIALAKFEQLYDGIAADGLASCVAHSNFTFESVTLKDNCRQVFSCVMENVGSSSQAILSSGSAILGFVPTVLLLLGNTNEEIICIHARFPLLALCLSITTINKGGGRAEWAKSEPITATSPSTALFLGPYGIAGAVHPRKSLPREKQLAILLAHVLAAAGAVGVIWQTVDLGKKAVMSWACWTDFYPAIWVCVSIFHHFLSVAFLRLSLQSGNPEDIGNGELNKGHRPRPRPSKKHPTRSKSVFMERDLTQAGLNIRVAHWKFASWSKAFVDLLNNVNYLYGTVVFSSLTLVSGHIAINVLVVYGIVTAVSRLIGTWTLKEMSADL